MPHSVRGGEVKPSTATVAFVSTRGGNEPIGFDSLEVQGLCPMDGGLYVPSHFPLVPPDTLRAWASLSFPDLAYAILSLYLDPAVIPPEKLRELVYRSYQKFDNDQVTPVRTFDTHMHLLELYHGPTLSFKDVALQFLGNFLEFLVQNHSNNNKSVVVLGATSGDTGSAAIAGLENKEGINVVIVYPKGRITPTQELQMISGRANNVLCLACPGNFDDCQALVKGAFTNETFQDKFQLLGINSINIVRILAQIVYYFYSYFCVVESPGDPVDFVVPTGNFGNVLAGYYAKRMGLPVGNLVIATNENDILVRFMTDGVYSLATEEGVQPTITPSMDIQLSSNFERYLYELAGRNTLKVAGWMKRLAFRGNFSVSSKELEQAQNDFVAYMTTQSECLDTISKVAMVTRGDLVIDPHTAVGVHAAYHHRATRGPDAVSPIICLATAHPAKFPDAVSCGLAQAGIRSDHWLTHHKLRGLESLPRRVQDLPDFSISTLRSYIFSAQQ